MPRKQLLLILGLIIITALAGSFFYFFQVKKTSQIKLAALTPAPITQQPQASIFIPPQATNISVGQKIPLEIKLKAENLRLSAVALRWTYKFSQDLPLKPLSLKMKPNPQFIENGWVYPVNKVFVDQESHLVYGELAAVIPTPEGFLINGEQTLATIDFLCQNPIKSLIFEFDPLETKATTKDGKLILPQLERTFYSINQNASGVNP